KRKIAQKAHVTEHITEAHGLSPRMLIGELVRPRNDVSLGHVSGLAIGFSPPPRGGFIITKAHLESDIVCHVKVDVFLVQAFRIGRVGRPIAYVAIEIRIARIELQGILARPSANGRSEIPVIVELEASLAIKLTPRELVTVPIGGATFAG